MAHCTRTTLVIFVIFSIKQKNVKTVSLSLIRLSHFHERMRLFEMMIIFNTHILMMFYFNCFSTTNFTSTMSFTDKVVVITGSSSGIGAATAEYFAKQNAKLVLVGRNLEQLEKTATECQKSTENVLQIIADVCIEEDAERIISDTIAKFGKLDVLINSAGIIGSGTIETTTLDQFDHIMNVNCRSLFKLTKLAVPHLIQTKGNVVNLSSVCGIRSFPNVLAYNMSKSAVDQFTNCVALELADKGIRVNSVCPGVIKSELHKRGGMDDEAYDIFLEHCKKTHALGRTGNVEEVAAAIAFLASDSASFITGVQLPVDGGRHAMCPR